MSFFKGLKEEGVESLFILLSCFYMQRMIFKDVMVSAIRDENSCLEIRVSDFSLGPVEEGRMLNFNVPFKFLIFEK